MPLRNYEALGSLDDLAAHCTALLDTDAPIAVDIETGYDGPDRDKFAVHPETAFVVGISFSSSALWAVYIPLRHDNGPNFDNEAVARLLWPVFRTGRIIAHNAGFELRHLSRWFMQYLRDDPQHGEQVRTAKGYFPIRSCTQVEAYLAAEQRRFGLKPLTKALFGHEMTELISLFPDLAKKQQKTLRFNRLDLTEEVVNYACEDSAWCWAIHDRYYPTVSGMGLFNVEHYIVQHILPAMEDHGVAYDWALMRDTATELAEFRDRFNAEVMTELTAMADQPIAINLGSPHQIGKVLYETLGMRTTVYTPGTKDKPKAERKMSTGAIALANLAKEHGVVKRILQWKEMTKLLGTYLEKYEHQYNYAEDGRAHPSHLSAFVITGRFAVSDPPYQQSPKTYHFDLAEARAVHAEHEAAHGKKCTCTDPAHTPPAGTCFRFNFRDVITSPPEHYILGFDLSQAELRAIAGEAQETALLRAFAANEDVHTLTASLMLGKPIGEVTKEDRAIGKTMNFALLYGMGIKSLADRLAVPVAHAQVLYEKYFAAFPRIAAWSAKQVTSGQRHGYVTSRFGRRLPIWEYQDEREWMQQKGDRACVNYPIQGAATGDYMKTAMVRAHRALDRAGLLERVHLVMNVHDALEFYVHKSLLPQEVIAVLQPAVIIPIPGWPDMKADWHIARSWGSPVDITVNADGSVLANGQRIEDELRPLIEEDEETGELIEVMPEVDTRYIAEVVAANQPRRSIVITIDAMPDEDTMDRFSVWLDATDPAGPDRLVLRTPEGDLPIGHEYAIEHRHLGQITVIFPSATVTVEADGLNLTDLAAGLQPL